MARSSASTRVLTDHDEIRQWAEERGATPSRVRGTGDDDDVGIIRLDFPGYSGEDTLEAIPSAQLEVQRAEREYDQFRDEARRRGVIPGWLR